MSSPQRHRLCPDNLREKTIIGYGAGLAAVSTMQTTGLRPAWFVDDTAALQGNRLAGAEICPPDALERRVREGDLEAIFVIVFAYGSQSVARIFAHLTSLGLTHGTHFTDCSVFQFESIAARLEQELGLEASPGLFETVRALAIYSVLDNRSSIAGSWLIQELMRHQLARGEGAIAEAGVYKGGNAFLSLSLLGDRIAGRAYHLFDSFEGLPALSSADPASRAGEFGDVTLAHIEELFSHLTSAHMHVGWFKDTFPTLADEKFCLVYVDCDLYEPATECSDFFSTRMTDTGILLFHDYWTGSEQIPLPLGASEPFTGVRRAVDELATRTRQFVIEFPETTHALVIKST